MGNAQRAELPKHLFDHHAFPRRAHLRMAAQRVNVGDPQERVQEPGVAEVAPRMFDDALDHVAGKGRHGAPDKCAVRDVEVVPRRRLRHAKRASHVGVVEDAARQSAEHLQESPEPCIVQARKQPFHVTKQVGLDVLLHPLRPEAGARMKPGLRKSAAEPELVRALQVAARLEPRDQPRRCRLAGLQAA